MQCTNKFYLAVQALLLPHSLPQYWPACCTPLPHLLVPGCCQEVCCSPAGPWALKAGGRPGSTQGEGQCWVLTNTLTSGELGRNGRCIIM